MEKHVIQEELKNCPGIVYYPDTNKLELVGRSIPENPDIQLEYINSGSSKYLYEVLKRLTGYGRSGKAVKIKWLYEEDDEAMLELGEHYRDTAGIPLEIEMIV